MRIVKEAAERKNEILDTAQKLFEERGFDNTSTNDIIEVVGIARGTLYHHFSSKEDILDCLIQRMTGELMSKAAAIASDRALPVLERLSLSIMALNVDSSIGHEVMEQVHKPQNALMHQKMQERLLNGIVPIITGLLKEGAEEGIFSCDYPEVAIEMCMLYSNTAFDGMNQMTPEQRKYRIMGFIDCAERVMGCKKGVMEEAILRIFANDKSIGLN